LKSTFVIALTANIILAFVPVTAASTGNKEDVGPGYNVEMRRMIFLRDGVELEAWIFRPSSLKSKAPTVLCLTQYEIDGMARRRYFTQRGYAYAQVYVPGRGRSGGVKGENLGLQVGRDGYDVVEWMAA
jgi:predicted acyl esterase